jgi:hypothetical protein
LRVSHCQNDPEGKTGSHSFIAKQQRAKAYDACKAETNVALDVDVSGKAPTAAEERFADADELAQAIPDLGDVKWIKIC